MSSANACSLEQLWMVNGEWQCPLSLRDRGLAYGDGVFETMRVEQSAIPFLERHLARLARGLSALMIELSVAALRTQIDDFTAAVRKVTTSPVMLKLIVTRGEGGQGYSPAARADKPLRPTVILLASSLSTDDSGANQPVTLATSQVRLAEQARLAGLKHLNRLEYVLAAADVTQRFQNAVPLLLSQNDDVIESLHHNVFGVQDGHIYTPQLTVCGVAGVLRSWLLDDVAATIQRPCLVTTVSPERLLAMDEVIIGNSVRGFSPVTEIIHQSESTAFAAGPVCLQLQQSFTAKLAQTTSQ